MKKNIKGAFCPKCNVKLYRVHVRQNKPTTCCNCKFVIENPYEIFVSRQKCLDEKEKDK